MILRQVALWAALFAVPLGLLSDALYSASIGFRSDFVSLTKLDVLAADPALLRWATFTDVWGYYLPLAPIALYLRRRFDGRSGLLDLYTAAALAAVVIGSAGALVLGAVGPALASGYATATASERPAYKIAAAALEDAVFVAIWQTFDALVLGFFYVGIGQLLRRERRWLGTFSMFIGIDAILAAVFRVIGLEPLAIAAIVVWLPLMTVWFLWLALVTLRFPEPRSAGLKTSHAEVS